MVAAAGRFGVVDSRLWWGRRGSYVFDGRLSTRGWNKRDPLHVCVLLSDGGVWVVGGATGLAGEGGGVGDDGRRNSRCCCRPFASDFWFVAGLLQVSGRVSNESKSVVAGTEMPRSEKQWLASDGLGCWGCFLGFSFGFQEVYFVVMVFPVCRKYWWVWCLCQFVMFVCGGGWFGGGLIRGCSDTIRWGERMAGEYWWWWWNCWPCKGGLVDCFWWSVLAGVWSVSFGAILCFTPHVAAEQNPVIGGSHRRLMEYVSVACSFGRRGCRFVSIVVRLHRANRNSFSYGSGLWFSLFFAAAAAWQECGGCMSASPKKDCVCVRVRFSFSLFRVSVVCCCVVCLICLGSPLGCNSRF